MGEMSETSDASEMSEMSEISQTSEKRDLIVQSPESALADRKLLRR